MLSVWCEVITVIVFLSSLTQSSTKTAPSKHFEEALTKIGEAFNIYNRFGFLTFSFRVFPSFKNDSTWVIREPTTEIFDPEFLWVDFELHRSPPWEGEFNIRLCANAFELLEAYFENFHIDGIDTTWKAFFPHIPSLAEEFGVKDWQLLGNYGYAFVRVYKRSSVAVVDHKQSKLKLKDDYKAMAEKMKTNSDLYKFTDVVGTHYLERIETGDAIYQVFVFDRDTFNKIRTNMNTTSVTTSDPEPYTKYFSNWYVTQYGKIMSASDDYRLRPLLKNDFSESYLLFQSYPSIFKLHQNEKLLDKLNSVNSETLISAKLQTTSEFIQKPLERSYYKMWLHNHLLLWEHNI